MQAPVRTRRSPLMVTAVILAVALAVFLLYAGLWTEKLWYDATGFTGVLR